MRRKKKYHQTLYTNTRTPSYAVFSSSSFRNFLLCTMVFVLFISVAYRPSVGHSNATDQILCAASAKGWHENLTSGSHDGLMRTEVILENVRPGQTTFRVLVDVWTTLFYLCSTKGVRCKPWAVRLKAHCSDNYDTDSIWNKQFDWWVHKNLILNMIEIHDSLKNLYKL